MLRDLQNNPIVFWFLAAMTVGSSIFAVYTFQITKPSRSLVYRVYTQNFDVPEGLEARISIAGAAGNYSPKSGFVKQIDVWNDGNLEVEPSYVLEPIRIKILDGDFLIDLIGRNVAASNFSYKNTEQGVEIGFGKLLPKAGFTVRYYSEMKGSVPQIAGLISDPIRGTVAIKAASFTNGFSDGSKTVPWYLEALNFLVMPLSIIAIIIAMKDFAPQTWRGRAVKGIITYLAIFSCAIMFSVSVYDFAFATPPF